MDAQDLRGIIEDGSYQAVVYTDLAELKKGLRNEIHTAAILDIDSVPLDSRTIRQITVEFPLVCFFCASRKRIHPELKDAICYHLFAALQKPVDPDELHYFLKCARYNQTDSRGPPES